MFDPLVHTEATVRTETERALRAALSNGELRLWCQPLIDLETDTVVGGEALVRWQHPTRGLLLPSDFLPLAEHCSPPAVTWPRVSSGLRPRR
jgi:sensor c-di-GMP phosphodiesterase-like protein